MRNRYLLLLLASVACGPSDQVLECGLADELADAVVSRGSEPLELLVCPLEPVVELGFPIRVAVGIGNVSDSAIVLRRPSFAFGAWLDARIQGPGGSVLERVSYIHASLGQWMSLEPGELVETVVDLRCTHEGPPGHENECVAPYLLELPGTYMIRMHYSYGCIDGPCSRGLTQGPADYGGRLRSRSALGTDELTG